MRCQHKPGMNLNRHCHSPVAFTPSNVPRENMVVQDLALKAHLREAARRICQQYNHQPVLVYFINHQLERGGLCTAGP
jgi:hypothetical protein